MVVKKSNVIGIALLLALAVSPISAGIAQGANNLVQLDLKRASNDSVNVTLFTSNNYNDNILVRKKSDNKYVILVPKVQSSGYSSPSLNGLKDLVSNVDVKTVNDTSGGYTKVTLITTKPLDIKTNTRQSAPVTAEQKEYKTLIAEANAIKNNIATPKPNQYKVQPKTEITVNKAHSVSDNVKKENSPQKTMPVVKTEVKPDIKLSEASKEKLEKQARKEHLAELIQEVKEEQLNKQVPQVPVSSIKSDPLPPTNVKDITEMPKVQKDPALSFLLSKIKRHIPRSKKGMLLSVFGLLIMFKVLKSIFVRKNNFVNTSYSGVSSNASMSTNNNANKYSSITENKELSWQEKYQLYLDASAKPVSRGKNKGNYAFIKTPAQPDIASQKRDELEKMLEEMPFYNNDIQPEIVEDVQTEDNAIQNTIKFKAFDKHKLSLNEANRNKINSRFKKYEVEIPLHEQKTVDLGSSLLHKNPRSLKDANLNVADVDKNRLKYKPTNYIMSSVDEYFSILDKEKTVPQTIQIQPVQLKNTVIKKQTNPISKLRNETKSSYLNNLIIKSGFNIDENKGFYMVNLDGKSALIGKVNDEITVLKRYDKVVDSPLQVRHDNANVYMVKAEGFKSLVEVNDKKMGVLIEL